MSKLPTARRDNAWGTLSPHASADSPGPETDQVLSGARAHGIGDAGFGIGADNTATTRTLLLALAPGSAMQASSRFGSNDDYDPASEDDADGASASFVSGSATFTAFASNSDDHDHCGIGAALDRGR